MIEIYKITFSDGTCYVGQTRIGLESRLYAHLQNPCNADLYVKLMTLTYETDIISRHRLQRTADQAEQSAILASERALNVYVGGRKIRDNPDSPPLRRNRWGRQRNNRIRPKYPRRSDGRYRCSWCRQSKHVSEYHSDVSRSSGLASRCKVCVAKRQAAIVNAIKAGKTASDGYRAIKAELTGSPA